jgi:hypothetical protein
MGDEKGSGDKMETLWWLLGFVPKIYGHLTKQGAATIEITDPLNRKVTAEQPWLPVRGKSKNASGKIYWLFTRDNDKYWPQKKITIPPDGQWESSVNVNTYTYIRSHFVVLAEVNAFADAVFQD